MKRSILIYFIALSFCVTVPRVSAAQTADTLKLKLNDYSMLGFQYGASLSSPVFSPSRSLESLFFPVGNVGVIYTRYCKMFGYLPYFGFQGGVFFTQEGYKFKMNEKSGYVDNILGASTVRMQTVEVPVMAHFHVDFWKMKIVANIGVYGGYRLNIERSDYVSEQYREYFAQYRSSFHPNEIKFDYGIKGGAGLALALDPIELHLMAWYKYAFALLHQPDVNNITLEHDDNSRYYYKWGNPTDIIVSLGLHYQLSKPRGYTKRMLRQQAKQQAQELFDEVLKRYPQFQNLEQEKREILRRREAIHKEEKDIDIEPETDEEDSSQDR